MATSGGAIGWLIGEENKGLACMFTMMNNARLGGGAAGCRHRRARHPEGRRTTPMTDGRASAPGSKTDGISPIIEHPDVQAHAASTMKALTARRARDLRTMLRRRDSIVRTASDGPSRRARPASDRAVLLTPIAKAFSTDIGVEVASIGDSGPWRHGLRRGNRRGPALCATRASPPIYEGTNGIQAIDLVTRKIGIDGGDLVAAEIARMRRIVAEVAGSNVAGFGQAAARLGEAVDALEASTAHLLAALKSDPADAQAGATPYARLFGLALGGTSLAEKALKARGAETAETVRAEAIGLARFFAENLATAAPGLSASVTSGGQAVVDLDIPLAS